MKHSRVPHAPRLSKPLRPRQAESTAGAGPNSSDDTRAGVQRACHPKASSFLPNILSADTTPSSVSPSPSSTASTVSPNTVLGGIEQAHYAALRRRRELLDRKRHLSFSSQVKAVCAVLPSELNSLTSPPHQARGLGTRIPDGPSRFRQQEHLGAGDDKMKQGDEASSVIHRWLEKHHDRVIGGRADAASVSAKRDVGEKVGGWGVALHNNKSSASGSQIDAGGRDEVDALRAEVKRYKAEVLVLKRDKDCLLHEVQRLNNVLKEEQQSYAANQREQRQRQVEVQDLLQEHKQEIHRLDQQLKQRVVSAPNGDNGTVETVERRRKEPGGGGERVLGGVEANCSGATELKKAPALPRRPPWLSSKISGDAGQNSTAGVSWRGWQETSGEEEPRDSSGGEFGRQRGPASLGRVEGEVDKEAQSTLSMGGVQMSKGPVLIPLQELQLGRKRGVGGALVREDPQSTSTKTVREEMLGSQLHDERDAKLSKTSTTARRVDAHPPTGALSAGGHPKDRAETRSLPKGRQGDRRQSRGLAAGFAFLSPSWWSSFAGTGR